MESQNPLSAVFLAHIGDGGPASDWATVGPIEDELRGLCQQAHAAWPDVDVSDEEFVGHVARCVGREGPSVDFLRGLQAADLLLSCGCARGLVPAIMAFERGPLANLPALVARFRLTESDLDELRQTLREKLLVGRAPDRRPRIADYGGRAPLSVWLRVTALREVLERQRRPENRRADGDALLAVLPAGTSDPELEQIRVRCKEEFASALSEAAASLTSEQRNLLRMYFIEQLSTGQIGGLFQVNRSTAVRWVQAAREALADATRCILRERLRLSDSDMMSLVGMVYSRIDVSIAGLLREGE